TLLQLEEDTEMAVIEMGMSGLGEIEHLSSIVQPDVAIITNVSEVHLADLKSRDAIVQAKLEILAGLRLHGLFVYNGDNPRLTQQLDEQQVSFYKTTSFGESTIHPWHPTSYKLSVAGVTFSLSDPASPPMHLPLLGKHQMINAMGAIAAARYMGISYASITKGLLRIEATGMRNERIPIGRHTVINDAYKSNPSSVRAALHTMYKLKGYKRKVVVLGDMVELGEESEEMHIDIGMNLDHRHVDLLICLGPMASYIAESAKRNFPLDRVILCTNQQQVVAHLVEAMQEEQCLILIKGSRSLQMEAVVDALRVEVSEG
ncbi:MAG: UDP-N-acetylmuramoyl-tripeptide--D-alanyl-D-alanine ligase, partial [Paenibacillus sp.]|nr:UDP-N-acetylmuramoyl-tripeptide--D-alanyl-D-alanine ligase [Paenibacillus sp.]